MPADASSIEHPNKAKGIAHVRLLASSSDYETFIAQIASVIGAQPTYTSHTRTTWTSQTPDAASLGGTNVRPQLILSVASSDADENYLKLHGSGIYEVAFLLSSGQAGESTSPYGRLVWEV